MLYVFAKRYYNAFMGKNRKKEDRTPNKIWLVFMILTIGGLCIAYTAYVDIYLPNKPENKVSAAYENVPLKDEITPLPEPTIAVTNTPKPTSTPEPTATPVPQIPEQVKEYLLINDETVGHIKIEGTVIDYPVVYSGDNDFYLHNDFNKQSSYAGAVFLDFRCNVYDMDSTRNIILYGHNNKDGTIFNGLVHYHGYDFFDEHRIITFDTLAGEMQWEVFTVFETHIDFYYINTYFETDRDWYNFITDCQDLSVHETDVVLQKDDIVLTLSTCAIGKDYRNVVMARLIK